MEDEDHTPTVAKDYYSKSIWWSKTPGGHKRSDRNGANSFYFGASGGCYDYNNSQEMATPEISKSFEAKKGSNSTRISETVEENKGLTACAGNGVYEISEADREENDADDNGHYSIQVLSTEIVEIVEDGKSITSNNRRGDDLYVAVGKDDLDVVQWALDHVVSPGARIFLVHVSPPITIIPTPVGKFERSQLTPQQVRLYVTKENSKRKDLLQQYIQLSAEAKVTAETLLLESNDTGKAILDLISILNITNIVIGIKKLPCSRRNNKLSKGEFVKKNAPKSCEVTLVYNGEEFVPSPYMDGLVSLGLVSQRKSHSKSSFLPCVCFSGCVGDVKDN